MKIDYEIKEDRKILFSLYTDKGAIVFFEVEARDILGIQRTMTSAMFDWCKKFNCKLDSPECY